MKRLVSVLIFLCLLCSIACAETVYVSISDDIGMLVLGYAPIETRDVDGDGTLTLYDALYCAHETAYEGGVDAGFAAADSGMGISLTKLWGVDNGGSYGYYVNDVSAMSLSDPITEGDHVRAYSYTDLVGWSDTYACFDTVTIDAAAGERFSLTLSAQAYDANWNTVVLPVENAVLTIDGVDSMFVTDAEGHAEIQLDAPGTYLISAHADHINLVAPVCIANIT